MAVDKSLSQHYAIQGGGPNYLGKQKMVKAPKKWQSSPDHDPAELAYITKKEKDILIALDVHGSLKDGKPNRGPSGIISLQGDLGGYSGSSGGHDHGGSDDDWHQSPAYNQPAPAPAPSPRAAGAESIGIDEITGASTYESDAEPVQNPEQASVKYNLPKEITGGLTDTTVVQDPEQASVKYNLPKEITGGLTDTTVVQDPERYPSIKPKLPVEITGGVEPTSYIDKLKNVDLKKKGKDFAASQAKKMARNKVMKELGLAGISPLLTLGSFLLGKVAPSKKAALQSRIDAATKKLIEPREPIDQRFQTYVQRKRTSEQRDSDNLAQAVSGKQDVVSKAVNQFRGTEVETYLADMVKNDLNRALRHYARMTPIIEEQSQQVKDAYEILGFYLNEEAKKNKTMMASTGGRVDKALTGRSRDI